MNPHEDEDRRPPVMTGRMARYPVSTEQLRAENAVLRTRVDQLTYRLDRLEKAQISAHGSLLYNVRE